MSSLGSRRRLSALAALLAIAVAVLALALPAAAAPPVPAYQAEGVAVSGGKSPAAAPLLAPGRYLDDFDEADQNTYDPDAGKYYRIQLHSGDTPYFSATQVPPDRAPEAGTSMSVALSLQAVGDSGCTFTQSAYSSFGTGSLNSLTAVLAPGEVGGPDWTDGCPTDAVYAVQVIRSGDAYAGTAVPTELAYRVEPRVKPSALPGAAKPAANLLARARTATVRLSGGSSYDNAPLVPAGQYRDTFTSGESRYYRVHLGWGQRLAYTVTVDQDARIDDSDGAQGGVTLANPLREGLTQPDRADTSGSGLGSTGGAMYGSTLVPVRYANRSSDDDDVKPYSIDGDYYLVVGTDYPDAGQPTIHVGYTLVVDVVGSVQRGPSYLRGGPVTSSSAAGSGSDSRVPFVISAVVLVVLVVAGLGLLVRRRRRMPAVLPDPYRRTDPQRR